MSTGKIIKVASNDLYGNVDDRTVSVFACFEHTKYMNNYVVFAINEENDKNNANKKRKLCYGSIHLKNKSLVIFEVKNDIKKYIDDFLDEYLSEKLSEYKLLDISTIDKVELVSYNEMEYDKLNILDSKSIPKVVVKHEENDKNKAPVFLYLLIFILVLLGVGLTVLYLKPELFTIKYKGIECTDNLYDNNIGLNYDIDKEVRFDRDNKVSSISIVRTYTFLDSNSYYEFKENNTQNNYFTNGEGYKYIDGELKFKLFYQEESVIDDYDEMLTYLKREGFSCIEREYEE